MSKISELSDGGSLVSSDYLIAVRSGGNVKVRMDSINVDQVDLGDNEFIRLGNSQDLTMVHTSTQSIINQAGIGDLLLQKAGTTKASITANGLEFPDNSKAIFGAGSDLQIYHDGYHSIIEESGAGSLLIRGDNTYFTNSSGTEGYADFIADGAVILRHNNLQRLATTATGIDVTGSVTADGLTVDGNARIEEIGAIAKLTLERGGTANSADSAAVDMLETNSGTEGANFGDAGTNGFRLKLDGSANDFLIQSGAATTITTRFGIDRDSGDISFYEDTGLTAKLTWSASNESLTFGTNLAITTNEIDVASGDLTLDVAGDIILDADSGAFRFKDAGTTLATFTSDSGSMVLYNATSDKDLIFKGNDGGSTITALTLDMSNAGAATFNSSITIPDWVYHSGDSNTYFGFPSGDEFKVVTANVGRLHIKGSESVWNEGGGNVDFRVESDSNSSAFFVDAAEDNVLMGRTSAQSYENTASTINVEATGSFSTSAVVKTGVGTTYVDSGWTFGNSRQVWLITLVGTNSTSNAHSTVAYIATVGAYNKTLVQLGNASDHFDNGYLSAQLDSGSASTVNLQVRWNSLYAGGTSDVTVQGLRLL